MSTTNIDERNNYKNKSREFEEINETIMKTRNENDKFMIVAKKILKRYHKAFEELTKWKLSKDSKY